MGQTFDVIVTSQLKSKNANDVIGASWSNGPLFPAVQACIGPTRSFWDAPGRRFYELWPVSPLARLEISCDYDVNVRTKSSSAYNRKAGQPGDATFGSYGWRTVSAPALASPGSQRAARVAIRADVDRPQGVHHFPAAGLRSQAHHHVHKKVAE